MFEVKTRVNLSHTDAAGVVFFPRHLELAHIAFEQLMRHLGWGIEGMLTDGRWLLPVVRVEADYRHPLRMGDALSIRIVPARLGESSFTLRSSLMLDETLASEIHTWHVFLDADDKRPRPLPETLRKGLRALQD